MMHGDIGLREAKIMEILEEKLWWFSNTQRARWVAAYFGMRAGTEAGDAFYGLLLVIPALPKLTTNFGVRDTEIVTANRRAVTAYLVAHHTEAWRLAQGNGHESRRSALSNEFMFRY
jgi:hypothetical protein